MSFWNSGIYFSSRWKPALLCISKFCSDLCAHSGAFMYWLWKLSWSFSEAERNSSPLPVPQGKWVPGSRGSLSSCFPCLEEARGSETRLPVTLNYLHECDCACWGGTLKTVCVCAYEIYLCRDLLRAHLSQGLIFICCVSTQWQCSAKKLTQVILACPSKETPP